MPSTTPRGRCEPPSDTARPAKTGRSRRLGFLVFVFWLATMAVLVWRERGGERWTPEATESEAAQTSSTFLGLYTAGSTPQPATGVDESGGESIFDAGSAVGQRVGHIHLLRRPETRAERPGSRFGMSAELDTVLLGRATAMSLEAELWRPIDGPGLELEVTVDSMGQKLELRGELLDGELVATVESAGEQLPLRFPVGEDLLLQTGFGTATQFPPMEVGDTFRIPSFDPLTLGQSEARVRCVGEARLRLAADGPSDAPIETKILEVETGGFESRVWVDHEGEVVRAETPFGMVLQRLTRAEARAVASGEIDGGTGLGDGSGADAAGDDAAGTDLLALTAVRPAGLRPFRGARAATLELLVPDGLELPDEPLQRRLGPGRYRLRMPEPPADSATDTTTNTATEPLAGWLAADPFVQSDHPRIVEKARAIVEKAQATDAGPWARALALHDWVFERIDKVPVMSIPSALEVLESQRGDCNEHTVLFTALARAVDLPTRIAIGLVWSDELDGFYYHAWPEVWIDGRFVRMDPTLGQPLADATHVKLLEGGIETWTRLLPFLGRLEITVEALADAEPGARTRAEVAPSAMELSP